MRDTAQARCMVGDGGLERILVAFEDVTGVTGLDTILHGGLSPGRIYMVDGIPGCGRTTLALQFLLEGVRQGEKPSTFPCRRDLSFHSSHSSIEHRCRLRSLYRESGGIGQIAAFRRPGARRPWSLVEGHPFSLQRFAQGSKPGIGGHQQPTLAKGEKKGSERKLSLESDEQAD